MFKKIFIILIIGLLFIPFSFASENLTVIGDVQEDFISSAEDSYSTVYFNSSAAADGNGSIDNPYKYLNSKRIGQNTKLIFANGEYEINSSCTISSFNSFIGEDVNSTIIRYSNSNVNFNNYGTLEFYNLTVVNPFINNRGTFTADNVIFKDSSSRNSAGVIYNYYTTSGDTKIASVLNLNNCSFIDNNARYGGVIFSFLSNVSVSNSYFNNNSAYQGGVLYSFKSNVNMRNSNFTNNKASIGGVICDLGSNAYLENLKFINNTVVYQGGAIYKMYGSLSLTSSYFADNSANEGEAVFCDNSTFAMSSNTFANNDVLSVLNVENFNNNIFIQSELRQADSYDINFISKNYTQMFYTPYSGSLPSKYDLRTVGLVTPVKNQGSDGNCWAFAALGALESCILKATGDVYDLSEENMKNLIALYSDYGWKMDTNNGGYTEMALGYLLSWLGPVYDSDDAYVVNTFLSPLMDSIMHVQNVVYLPRSSYTDNDAIKQAILNYGGVYTGIGFYNSYLRSYNYYNHGNAESNHAVVIVGWDDNYSRNLFRASPPGDGAWICKNSWGDDWGNGGYFYVSYYDITCARVGDSKASLTFILNDTIRYDKNYQYDVIGITDYLLTNQSSIWYQNNFNATSDEIISAFSTFFNVESNFTVEIYVNDELKLSQTGSSPSGYYTINLDEFIPVYKNDLFKIILKITTATEAWIPISENVSSTRIHYKPNISFFSLDGVNWIDLYDYILNLSSRGHTYKSQVACIKAFTIFNLTTSTNISEIYVDNYNVNFVATVSDQYGRLVNKGNVIFEHDGIKYNRSVVNGKSTLTLKNINSTGNITAIYQNNTHYSSSEDESSFDIPQSDMNLTLNVTDIYYDEYLRAYITLSTVDGGIVDSNLTLEIDNKSYIVKSNSVFTIPYLLDLGQYEVNLTFIGNNFYKTTKTSHIITVRKYYVNLTAEIADITYGEYLKVNAHLTDKENLINESVILNINNVNYTFTANNDFIIPVMLNASSYEVKIYYNGSDRYNAANFTSQVKVSKFTPEIGLEINNVSHGENTIFGVKLTGINDADLNQKVILDIGSYNYELDANTVFTLPEILDAGNYTAKLYYSGDNNYFSQNISKSFHVNKLNVSLTVDRQDIVYGEYLVVNNTCSLDCNLTLKVNGKSYSVKSNSSYKVGNLLNAGNYSVNLIYEGDTNHNPVNKTINIVVSKYVPHLSFNATSNIDYGDIFIVNTKLLGINGKKLNYKLILNVNNKNYTFNANSRYELPTVLDAGKYVVKLYYNGNTNYKPVNCTSNLVISKINCDLSFNVSDVSYGEDIIITSSLTGINGIPLNKSINLKIANKTYKIYSNTDYKLPEYLDPGHYPVKLYFDGDNNYLAQNVSNSFNVYKSEVNLIIDVDDIVYGEYLVVNNSCGFDCNLSLEVNGKSYTVKSDSSFRVDDLLNAGNYDVKLSFAGNDDYYPVNKTVNVIVHKFAPDLSLNVSSIDFGDILIVNTKLLGINGKKLNYKLLLIVDNNNYTIDSNSKFDLPDILDIGNYTAELYFEGNKNYLSQSVLKSFSVNKLNVDLSVDVQDIVYGEFLLVNNSCSLDCNLSLEVNGKSYVVKSGSSFRVDDLLDAGSYEIKLTFAGNNIYNPVTKTANVIVSKSAPDLSLNTTSSIDFGDILIVETKLLGINGIKLNEKLILIIDNKNYTIDSNSKFDLPVILDAGNYTAELYFEGNKNYLSQSVSTSFDVNKLDVELSLSVPSSIVYGEFLVVNNSCSLDCNLSLEVNGRAYDVKSGSTFIVDDLLDAGSYDVKLTFGGNNNYNPVYKSAGVVVSKNTPDLSLSVPSSIVYGEFLVVNNSCSLDCNLSLEVNGRSYTVKSGSSFIVDDLLDAGSYDVKLTFGGNNNYNPVYKTASVVVSKNTPDLSLSVPSGIDYGSDVIVTSTLTGINGVLLDYVLDLSIANHTYKQSSNSKFTLPDILDAGNYTAKLYFKGNENYLSANKTVNFSINKLNTKITLNVADIIYGDYISGNITLMDINNKYLDGNIILLINDEEYTFKSNDKFVIPVILNVSKYSINAVFSGENNYYKSDSSSSFNVLEKELKMDLNIEKIVNNALISIKLSDKSPHDLNVLVNNKNYSLRSVDGEAILNLTDLDLGSYAVEVLFNESNYKPLEIKETFNVNSINTVIRAENVVMYYHDGTRLYMTLMDSRNNTLSNKTLEATINGVTYTRTTNVNGTTSIPLGLNGGIYPVDIEFKGDGSYFESSATSVVNIKSTVLANDLTKYYRNSSQFYATVLDYNGNPLADTKVQMNINGVFYNRTTNSSGIFRLNINLYPGKYILTVYNPLTNEMASSTITVLSVITGNKDLVKYYRNDSQYYVSILNDDGSPKSGAQILININGVFYYRTTNENGTAKFNINLYPGQYTITVEYNGLRASNNIKVLPVLKANDLSMFYQDGSKFEVKVLDGQGNPYSGQEISFNINGVFYNRITDENGYARLTIRLMPGVYIITSTYNSLNIANVVTVKNR